MNERSLVEVLGTHMAWRTGCAGILIEQIRWVDTLSAILLTGLVEGSCNCCRGRNQRLVETWIVSLCALRWCLCEVSNCFISGIFPISAIARVRTSRGQVLKLVRVLSVLSVGGVVRVLVLRVHIGGTNGEVAEVSCNWDGMRNTGDLCFIKS